MQLRIFVHRCYKRIEPRFGIDKHINGDMGKLYICLKNEI